MVPIYKGGGGRLIGSHKLQTSQFNLLGLQANGIGHSRVPKTSLGYELMVVQRPIWI